MSVETVALFLDPKDIRYPTGFKLINFKGATRMFYPGGINPETGRFEPVILSETQYLIAKKLISGRATVIEMDLMDAISRISASNAAKIEAPARPEVPETEEREGEGEEKSIEQVRRGPGRPRKV